MVRRSASRSRAREASRGVNINCDLIAYTQDEGAGILEPPLDVGNRRLGRDLYLLPAGNNIERKRDVVILPMQANLAGYFQFGWAFRGKRALYAFRRENNFRKFIAFENLAMHPVVAAVIAGVSAGRVDHDGAAGRAGGWIEADRAAFEFESSVNGVESRAESELNFRLRRIELNGQFLRTRGRDKTHCGQNREGE